MMKDNLQAFFSCTVSSPQDPFMRSLRLIHRSACSLGGMPSHLFSMSARVTLETACETLRDCESAVAARRVDDGEVETLASLDARRTEVRNIVVIGIYKKGKNEWRWGEVGKPQRGFAIDEVFVRGGGVSDGCFVGGRERRRMIVRSSVRGWKIEDF